VAGCYYTLVFCSADFLPWRWKWYVPPKRRSTYDPHGAMAQKMAIFMTTAVRTSNPTWIERVHSEWWIANGNFSSCNSTADCVEQQTFWTCLRIGTSFHTSEIDEWVWHLVNKPAIQYQRQSVSQSVCRGSKATVELLFAQYVSLSFQCVSVMDTGVPHHQLWSFEQGRSSKLAIN
jgi:hypothetical protein